MLDEQVRQIPYDPSKYARYAEYLIDSRSAGTRIYLSRPIEDGRSLSRVEGTRYAVKVVPSSYMSQRKPHNVRNEAMTLSKLAHINIIDLTSAFYDASQEIYELHMPFVDLPLLAILSHPHFSALPFPSYLESPPPNPFLAQLPNVHALITRSILFQVLRALAYLHGQNPPIAHRDVNPGNILLTRNGTVKLVDFGVVWDTGLGTFTVAGESPDDAIYNWNEDPEDMCGQVATGPYRAPELMYSPKKYDPVGTDLWSMGVTMAVFYAPINLELDDDGSSDSQSSSASSKEQNSTSSVQSTPGYVIPVGLSSIPLHATWRRDALFDATRGEIAMLWSIFRLMGTPTQDSWPGFLGHQEGSVIRFRDAEKQPLEPLLPHLPPASNGSRPLKMIEGFLNYPPNLRLTAKDALRDPWFVDDGEGPLMLPLGYPTDKEPGIPRHMYEIEGKSLENILAALVQAQEKLMEDETEPRDEWD